MASESKNTAELIEAKLREARVTMVAQHVPTTYDPSSKEWQHIAWRITIESPRGKMTTDYRQGIGHLPGKARCGAYHRLSYENNQVIAAMLKTGKVCIWGAARVHVGRQPLPIPRTADVFGSLLLDASAADYASFEDWAAEYGYDADSIKAKGIYDACRDIALQLYRVIGAQLAEELKPLAQEL